MYLIVLLIFILFVVSQQIFRVEPIEICVGLFPLVICEDCSSPMKVHCCVFRSIPICGCFRGEIRVCLEIEYPQIQCSTAVLKHRVSS